MEHDDFAVQDISLQRDGYSKTFSTPRALHALSLSGTEKMIISNIVSLSSKYVDYGGCNLTNGAIAERHFCTKTTVSGAISKATWYGLLKSRTDEIVNINTSEGLRPYQVRRIEMVIPDFWELFGEIWAEFYFKGCEESKAILMILKDEIKKQFGKTEQFDPQPLVKRVVETLYNNGNTPLNKQKHTLNQTNTPPTKKFKGVFLKLNAFTFTNNNIFTYNTFTEDIFKKTNNKAKNSTQPIELTKDLKEKHSNHQNSSNSKITNPSEKNKRTKEFKIFQILLSAFPLEDQNNQEVHDTINCFIDYRTEIKKSLGFQSAKLLSNKLKSFQASYNYSTPQLLECLQRSIIKQWDSIFKLPTKYLDKQSYQSSHDLISDEPAETWCFEKDGSCTISKNNGDRDVSRN